MCGWLSREQGQRFLAKAVAGLLVTQKARRQHLHRHVAAQLLVPGAVHLAHAAGAELLEDPVVGERAADHGHLPSARNRVQTSTPVKGASRSALWVMPSARR